MPDSTNPTDLPELLRWAHRNLAQAEEAISALADQEPDGLLAWGMPLAETAEARDALSRAPSLQAEPAPPPLDTPATADTLLALAESVNRALVKASGQATNADDLVACLDASSHLDRLCDLLE